GGRLGGFTHHQGAALGKLEQRLLVVHLGQAEHVGELPRDAALARAGRAVQKDVAHRGLLRSSARAERGRWLALVRGAWASGQVRAVPLLGGSWRRSKRSLSADSMMKNSAAVTSMPAIRPRAPPSQNSGMCANSSMFRASSGERARRRAGGRGM